MKERTKLPNVKPDSTSGTSSELSGISGDSDSKHSRKEVETC